MIKEALEYLVGLKDAKTFEIDGKTYCTQNLNLIEHKPDRPHGVKTVGSLDALVKLITVEVERLDIKLFVNPVSPTKVEVFSTFDDSFDRYDLYAATCDVPGFSSNFYPYERMMIMLRSQYIANDGMKYLLDLLSHISNEESVKSSDNGVTQKLLFATDTVNLPYIVDGLTMLAVECNYSADNLNRDLNLPDKVKQRILRNHMEVGTLISYIQTLDLLRLRVIYLMHLSDGCSDEVKFVRAVSIACAERGYPKIQIVACKKGFNDATDAPINVR